MAPVHKQFLLRRLARSWKRINMCTISWSVHLCKLVLFSLQGSLTSRVIWRTPKVVSHLVPATARVTLKMFSILGSPVLHLFLLSFLLLCVCVCVCLFVLFCFVSFGFVSFRLFCFVWFRFVSFRFVCLFVCFVLLCFVSFRLVSFRLVSFCFVLFCLFVSFRFVWFRFVSFRLFVCWLVGWFVGLLLLLLFLAALAAPVCLFGACFCLGLPCLGLNKHSRLESSRFCWCWGTKNGEKHMEHVGTYCNSRINRPFCHPTFEGPQQSPRSWNNGSPWACCNRRVLEC